MGFLEGVIPAVAMPFSDDGSVNEADFSSMITRLDQTGAQGLILFGLASEFYKLSDKEKSRLARLFLDGPRKAQRILSVTDHATELALLRAEEYQSLGADGLMLFPPFFLSPSPHQLWAHISRVLKAVTLPIILQYAPRETQCPFSMEDMAALGQEFPHLVYKIEAPRPMEEIQHLLRLRPRSHILNGYAGIHMFSVLESGGKGIIPGCSFTEVYLKIYNLYQGGLKDEAQSLHTRLKFYIDQWMGHVESIIQIEKSILKARGWISSSYCRKPSFEGAVDEAVIHQFLQEFSLLGGP